MGREGWGETRFVPYWETEYLVHCHRYILLGLRGGRWINSY